MSEFDDREEEHDEDEDDIEYTIKVSFILLTRLFRVSDCIRVFKKIIGKRKNGRTYEYQVVWSGCDEDTATWEPEDNLQNAKAMISNFERSELPLEGFQFRWLRIKIIHTSFLMSMLNSGKFQNFQLQAEIVIFDEKSHKG